MRRNLALDVAPITDSEFNTSPRVMRAIQQATQHIVERGTYTNPNGVDISIAALQQASQQQRIVYRAGNDIPSVSGRYTNTHAYVYNQSALTVARERARQGYRVVMLNFASRGSGDADWMPGYVAQEASLWGATSLSYSMQAIDWVQSGTFVAPVFDHSVVVTPRVPVFRDHNGDLLDEPWLCDFVHAYAVDAHTTRRVVPEREAEIPQIMLQRAICVLQSAATTRANVLVLGAWGCGQAGNDPAVMAAMWQVAIEQTRIRTFGIIDFAVADVTPAQAVYTSFVQRLHKREFQLT